MNDRSIFLTALEKTDAAERAAYLDEVCAGDDALRQQVERLLGAHFPDDSFLEKPALATLSFEPITERVGAMIGPYKLLQQIGEGGMGVVFMAEQDKPVRRMVALKIIKPGMDTRQVIARFESERQALAMMDHPNIARVLDAGTTDSGRPFFVMELVKGIPITKFCDENQLTPRQRLELFVSVCQALQHAHQKGIIHRDLKPSNVLIAMYDDKPVAKIIDFGVAKATSQKLTERTLFTEFGSIVGTLEYMSPEQAKLNALDIDTRSDVYALGVLLYELLTGTTPLDKTRLRELGYEEMLRLIREEEAPKPSMRLSSTLQAGPALPPQRKTEAEQLTKLLRGELDWIVLKALEKDRARRYDTASAFARDVERYLKDEPVEACPPSVPYRLKKYARKHKTAFAMTSMAAALLLFGIAATSWQAVRATRAEGDAIAELSNAEKARQGEAEQRAIAVAAAAEAKTNEQKVKEAADEVRALNDRLRSTLYAAHINLAQNAWEAGGIARVDELLEQHRPKPGESDLRGFEWYYLYRLCHAELLTINGGRERVAYSPDGKRLASAGKVWDAQTGQELLTLKDAFGSMAFSPEGKRLASPCAGLKVGDAQGLKVWDAQTGQELLTFKRPVRKLPKGNAYGVWRSPAFSPDGKRLASVSIFGTVQVWDAQTGQELLAFDVDPENTWKLEKGGGPGNKTIGSNVSLVFSPDGKRLAYGSGSRPADRPGPPGPPNPTEVKVWDTQTGQELLSLKGHTNYVNRVAFSPDGKRLASGSGNSSIPGEVKVWDVQTGRELLTFKGHTKAVDSVAFSPDGQRLATSGGGEVKVWNAQTGQELLTYRYGGAGVVFSSDGQRLASVSGNTVKVWDAPASQLLAFKGHEGTINNAAFSPDGKRLASGAAGETGFKAVFEGRGGSKVKVWDAQTGQELLTLKGAGVFMTVFNFRLFSGPPFGSLVAFSPDGKRLATNSVSLDEVKVWDAQTGQELLALQGHTGWVLSVAFSSDGKRLASASGAPFGVPFEVVGTAPTEVKVWDAQTGQELLTLKGHLNYVNSVAFSPDGKRLASGSGKQIPPNTASPGEVKVWDAQTGQELLTFKGHTNCVLCVAFSPDGKRLASASTDGTLKLWDAQTCQELLTLKGHLNYVNRVTFSPDGRRLASAGRGEVKVWDAQTGQELLTLEGHGGYVNGVAFSPDGHRLVSGAADGTLKIWDATPVPEKSKPLPDRP